MLNGTRRMLRQFAQKILDIDNTEQPTAHIRLFEDYLGKYRFDTDTADAKEFLAVLKRKHLVDDIVVSSLNGSAIASVNGNAVSQAVTGAALFNYVKSEIPKSETIMIRSANTGGWNMIFQMGKKLYIIKASSDMSTLELKALGREIDNFLLHNQGN